jgi:hypothetical protein
VRLSGYPVMAVLKTTSPAAGTVAPKEKPWNTAPFSRIRRVGIKVFIVFSIPWENKNK